MSWVLVLKWAGALAGVVALGMNIYDALAECRAKRDRIRREARR